MKKLLTIALAAFLTTTMAMAHSTKPTTNSTPVAKSTSTSLTMLAEVATENLMLRAKLAALETDAAELNSQISYHLLMGKVMTKLNALENADAWQEAQATIQYVTTMTNVLLNLQSTSILQHQQELQAQLDYQKNMKVVLAKLNMHFDR